MGNFKAAALLAVAAILGASSLASQHHGQSPDLPDFRQPNDSVLEESMVRFNHNVARNFSSLVFDVTRGQLIVAARDYLFRLSLDGLALLEESRWPADDKAVDDCQLNSQGEDDCHNFIHVLHVHGDRLLACGTNAFTPRCSWRPLKAINNISECFPCLARCPHSPHSHMSSLLSSGPAGTADLFIGSPTDLSSQEVAIFRLPLNSSVSNTSADSFIAGPQLGHLRTLPNNNNNWLDAAEFVASVEVDQFVFFFFREVAVEVSNCGKAVYSRVARVCKNDVGQQMLKDRIWTTFVKARLNCSVPAEYPFYYDHIQSVAYVEEERLFYAAFTTAENSIAGSAVCSFTLDSMQESFAGPFKFQSSPNSTWESVNSTHAHSHCNSIDPSSSLVEAAGKYQLMDRAVPSLPGKYGSKPLIQLDLERFNHIAVDVVATKNHSSIHVLYVASRDGFVRKYSVLPSTQERCLVEIVDPFARLSHQPADRQIKTMQFLKVQNALYIGTENEVIRLVSQRCKRFANRTQCLDSADPYCGWQSQLRVCSPPPDNNPHASCWEQLQQTLTTCPTSISPEGKSVNGESSSTIVGGGGVCGCNESSIIAKLAEQVKQGAPGVDGKPGMTGIPGAQGQMGPTGPEGPAGEKGERGDGGPIGKEGPSGPKGEPGRDGPPGDLGKLGLPGTKGDRGTDGEMGPKGDSGEPGSPGTKGEIGPACPVGPSVISSVEGAKGNQGDRGKRGKPGPPGPPGPPSEPSKSGSSSSSQGGEESPKGVAPGIVTVKNMEALFEISDVSPVGTIAYLYEEESLLLRVRKGWQYISMGKFVPLPTPTTTTTIPPPTTLKKSSAAENMIPKIPRVPSLRMVALNEPLTGNMGGIQRVDYACFRQARQAGLRGTFRAFLASRVQKIDKIVRPPYRGYPIINLRGEMLFRTWNDLFHGRSASELSPARQQRHDIYSFNNRNIFNDIVWPQKVVWHGAGPSGERQLDSYCDAWTSSDAKTLGVAASLIASSPSSHQQQQQTGGGGGKLLGQDKFSCQNRFVVLCIEATSQVVASGWVKRVVEHFEQKTI